MVRPRRLMGSTRSRVLVLVLTLGASDCSSFDPVVGGRRTALQEDVVDASPDAELADGAPDVVLRPGDISFRRDIRPLLDRTNFDATGKGCKACHYATEANHSGIDLGGFDMTTLGAIREGGGSSGRRTIVAGKPGESGFIQKLKGQYPYGSRMPKNGPPYWSDADVKLVSDWIAQGAKGADDE